MRLRLPPPTPDQVLVALAALGTLAASLALYLHVWSP
jgi:hypothetical protein